MAASPLLGYNTNVRHLGKLFHIQTEDSGSSHGHIFTHLFADGGRIVASKKTTYSHYIDTVHYPAVVKQLMRESHKAMFIALRDGLFDEDEAAGARTMAEMEIRLPDEPAAAPPPPASAPAPAASVPPSAEGVDVDALERAAAAQLAGAHAARTPSSAAPAAPPSPGRYAATRPASVSSAGAVASPGGVSDHASSTPAAAPQSSPAHFEPSAASESIFGGDLLSEKSLDEVILSYLAEDVEEEG